MSTATILTTDLSGQRSMKTLPPTDLLHSEPIKAAARAHEQALAKAAEARRELDELQGPRQRAAAEQADARLLADATKTGKKADPGTPNVDKHERAVAEARRQHAAAQLIADDCQADLEATAAKHADEWLAEAERRYDEAVDRYGALLGDVQAAADAMMRERAVINYLTGSRRFKMPTPAVFVNDERKTVAELIDLLAELGATPERPSRGVSRKF